MNSHFDAASGLGAFGRRTYTAFRWRQDMELTGGVSDEAAGRSVSCAVIAAAFGSLFASEDRRERARLLLVTFFEEELQICL